MFLLQSLIKDISRHSWLWMKHSRFKYFPDARYAEMFLDGRLRCRTAAYFRDYEDAQAQQVIGDEYEGARIYRPPNGLEVDNQTQKTTFTLNMGMKCLTRAHEIYIFMSCSFNDSLKTEFKAAACVEVLNPRAFIYRWLDALPEEAKKEGKNVARRVKYYLPEDVPGKCLGATGLLHLIVSFVLPVLPGRLKDIMPHPN